MWELHPFFFILVAFGLLVLAFVVFTIVRKDYRTKAHLSPLVSSIQVGYFCVYALCSYIFLDSRISNIQISGWTLLFAIILMIIGFGVVLFSMPKLGWRSFGQRVDQLYTKGLYQYTRNPQLVGSFLFILGYALLWPSWQGLIWALLWVPISVLMIRGEEEHLRKVFGQKYLDYCDRTPRFFGFPK